MAGNRDSAPESLAGIANRGSGFLTESTYRPETASDHLADSIYRPGTSSDQTNTSDFVDETRVPTRLKGSLKSRIINQLCDAYDFSADILHIPHQPARLVLQLGPQDGTCQRHGDSQENTKQSRKIKVSNLPPAAENEEYLDVFFESTKRQGGGPVKKVTLMKDKHSAIVEFEEHDAVRRVLDKAPITMHNHVVDVEAMVTILDDGENIDSVQIRGLKGLADEIRGFDVDSDAKEEAQTPERSVIIYSGLEAAKVWHFCPELLENIVTNFDAVVTTDPDSGIPNTVTITAEKKFEENIRKRLREVKEKLLPLQEDSVTDTDITSDLVDDINCFNANNQHILLVGDEKRRKVFAVFDDTVTPKSTMDEVRRLISQPSPSIAPGTGSGPVVEPHNWKAERLVSAALEIGHKQSGFAYSFRHEYLQNPTRVNTKAWHGSGNVLSLKIPTVILFDKNMHFHSAGFDAEDNYSELVLNNEDSRWHYFERFTSCLVGKKVDNNTQIEDHRGRKFPAKDVICGFMCYLKNQLFEWLNNRTGDMQESDIQWVVIVPTCASESAQVFIRDTAIKAGIRDEQLSLVLQPIAVSFYVQVLPADSLYSDTNKARTPRVSRKKSMIVDVADEVSCITVLERKPSGDQEKIFMAFQNLCITDGFFTFLEELFGHETLTRVKSTDPNDFHILKRELELKCRSYKPTEKAKSKIKIPIVFEECFYDRTGKRMQEAINDSRYKERARWFGSDKLICDVDTFTGFFESFCTKLVGLIRKALESPQSIDIGVVVMSGDYADFPIIKDCVRNAFKDKQVITLDEPGIAAMKGAVIYGHKPQAVPYRIPRYTYGIIGPTPIHEAAKQQSDSPIHVYFPKGQTVRIGEIRSKPCYIENDWRDKEWQWKLFASERKFLSTVDEGCKFLGTITLTVPAADKPIRVDVDLTFGGTEIRVEARDVKAGKSVTACMEFLG